MVVRIRVRPILAAAIVTEVFERAVFAALLAERFQLEKLQRKIARTWSSEPDFDTKIFKRFFDTVMQYKTDDVRFVNLDRGTLRRWAVMSKGYQPKSRVRKIGAWAGRGGPVVRGSTNMVRPMPGIKPRFFTEEMAKRRRKPFAFNMQRAFNRAAKAS